MVGALLLVSVGAIAAAVYEPVGRVLFNNRDGTGRLSESWQGGTWLTAVLPTFLALDWRAQLPGLSTWLLAGGIAFGTAVLVGRQASSSVRAYWSGVSCLVCFGLVGSGLHARVSPDQRGEWEQRGRLGLLAAYDGDRLQGYSYRERRLLDDAGLLRQARVVQQLEQVQWLEGGAGSSVPEGMIAGPFALAAGRYTVRVTLSSIPSPGGELWLAYHRGPGRLAFHPIGVEKTVALPVTLDPVWLGASTEEVAKSVSSVEIVPEWVLPRSARIGVPNIRFAEVIGDDPTRRAFYLDDQVWVEPDGFWVRGGGAASILVSPAGAPALFVTIQNGAEPGPVTVEFAGRREVVMLNSFATRRFRVPVDG